jgi:CDP-glycerol glycerophosphotransferase
MPLPRPSRSEVAAWLYQAHSMLTSLFSLLRRRLRGQEGSGGVEGSPAATGPQGASSLPDSPARRTLRMATRNVEYSLRYFLKDRLETSFHRAALSARCASKLPIDDALVMYEAYNGRDFAGNPHALLRFLLEEPRYAHLRHVVAVNDVANPIARRYADHPNVEIVAVHSDAYIRYAHTCRYFINNASFKPYIVKRPGQVYVTTWHSTLLKKLARDAGKPWESRNVARALVASDYFISPNRYTTEYLFRSHGVDGIFSGRIAEFGYPRNDLLHTTDRDWVRSRLGVSPHERVALYAPTWRGSYTPENTVAESLEHLRRMREQLPDDVRLLVKFHTLVYTYIEGPLEDMAPVDLDTNELLCGTDFLITDYSGIFFDYLVTNRPIVFFMPDLEEYRAAKSGFYLDLEDLPGPMCSSPAAAADLVATSESWTDDYRARYEEARTRFVGADDGEASRRTAQLIFDGIGEAGCRGDLSSRRKILFYPANLAGNGVTESFLSLLDSIDYETNDVVVLLPNDKKYRDNQLRIHPRAKVFYQNFVDGFTRREHVQAENLLRFGVRDIRELPVAAFQRTLRRVFGDLEFDAVVNFNGYFPNAAAKFATGPKAQRRLIYLHNDLVEDLRIKHPQLHAVFSVYPYYDRLVCVSPDSLEANRKSIERYVQSEFGFSIADKMHYARNVVNVQGIRRRGEEGTLVSNGDDSYLLLPGRVGEAGAAVPFSPDMSNFTCVGRLSPEKNHARLLRSFREFTRAHPHSHLYIVGTGKLEAELKDLADGLGLSGHVTFTGFLPNPLPLVANSDALVLSSDIEGQPITVLEALVLGTTVVATDIPGPRALLQQGGGMLVEPSDAGLLKGLNAVAQDEGQADSSSTFDAEGYVEEALDEFYSHLTVGTT